jgi:hypothetical protein
MDATLEDVAKKTRREPTAEEKIGCRNFRIGQFAFVPGGHADSSSCGRGGSCQMPCHRVSRMSAATGAAGSARRAGKRLVCVMLAP